MQKRKKRKKGKKDLKRQPAHSKTSSLSVCMIVKNEAERIERAICSVLPFADEVVVVDTGSTDDTVEIAKRLGAKIGYFEWCDDFAAARNASIDLATGDWIMWLDADDLVPKTEWIKLKELKGVPLDQAFMFKLINRGTSSTVFWQLRMFPNKPEIRFMYPVHEQVMPSLEQHGIPIRAVDINVIHTGYSSPEISKKKTKRNTELLIRYLEKDPDEPFCLLYLGRTYLGQGNFHTAIAHLERAVFNQDFKKHHKNSYVLALTTLARAYLGIGEPEKGINFVEEAYNLDPNNTDTIIALAQIYNQLEKPEKALEAINQLNDTHFQPSMVPIDLNSLRSLAEFQKAVALAKQGNMEDALYACRSAERFQKTEEFDAPSRLALSLLTKLKETPDGIKVLAKICKSDLVTADDLYEYGNALVRHGRLEEAILSYKRALKYKPSHEKTILALSLIYRRQGQVSKSISLLKRASKSIPENRELINNLADIYFEQEDWRSIINLPRSKDILPTQIAAKLISGLDEDLEIDLVELFETHGGNINELENLGVRAIWKLAVRLDHPFRFHLAVACFWTDVTLTEAAEVSVDGYLFRNKINQALRIAETYLRSQPSDPKGFEILSKCYREMGATEAEQSCLAHMEEILRSRCQESPLVS